MALLFNKKEKVQTFSLPEAVETLTAFSEGLVNLFVAIQNKQITIEAYDGYYNGLCEKIGVGLGVTDDAAQTGAESVSEGVENSVENVETGRSAENEAAEISETEPVEAENNDNSAFDKYFQETAEAGEAEISEIPDSEDTVSEIPDTEEDEVVGETEEDTVSEIPDTEESAEDEVIDITKPVENQSIEEATGVTLPEVIDETDLISEIPDDDIPDNAEPLSVIDETEDEDTISEIADDENTGLMGVIDETEDEVEGDDDDFIMLDNEDEPENTEPEIQSTVSLEKPKSPFSLAKPENEDETVYVGEDGVLSEDTVSEIPDVTDEVEEEILTAEIEETQTGVLNPDINEPIGTISAEADDEKREESATSDIISKNANDSRKEENIMADNLSELVREKEQSAMDEAAKAYINPDYANIDAMDGEALKDCLKKLGLYGAINKIVGQKDIDSLKVYQAASGLYSLLDTFDEKQALVAARFDTEGLDISKYVDNSYSPVQMRIIGDSVLQGKDVKLILNSKFTPAQMMKLLELQEQNFDITFADPEIDVNAMDAIVKGIKLGVDMSLVVAAASRLTWLDIETVVDIKLLNKKEDMMNLLAEHVTTEQRTQHLRSLRQANLQVDYELRDDGSGIEEITRDR